MLYSVGNVLVDFIRGILARANSEIAVTIDDRPLGFRLETARLQIITDPFRLANHWPLMMRTMRGNRSLRYQGNLL